MVEWEVDEHGYPTDASIAAIEALSFELHPVIEGARFMTETFPAMASTLPCGQVTVADIDSRGFPAKEIRFVTGGWSGCEDLINAVLGHVVLRHLYYAKWERGGLHVFVVPTSHLKPEETPATNAADTGSTRKQTEPEKR